MMIQAGGANWIGEPTCVMFRRQLALDAGGLRGDIYQLVDLDFWLRLMLRSAVCFVPQKLSVRTHTIGSTSIGNVTTRRDWLDHLRILTWLIVDPASPTVVRVSARVWWVLAWLQANLVVALFGPERRSRLKTLADLRVTEFAHARQLVDALPSPGRAA
jgi:hypothetical protein